MTLDQTLVTVIIAFVTAILGALVGGGAALAVADRMVKNVLASPLLIQQSQALAASWPAPIRELAHDTADLVAAVTADTPTTTTTTTTSTGTVATTPVTLTAGTKTNQGIGG